MPRRVLIVEDSQTQALCIEHELVRYGLDIEIARDGREGFAAAHRLMPDVIVLDVDLPEIDGYSLCRQIKSDPNTSHIPIIMLTHIDEASAAVKGLAVGATDYIPKDFFATHNLVASLKELQILE